MYCFDSSKFIGMKIYWFFETLYPAKISTTDFMGDCKKITSPQNTQHNHKHIDGNMRTVWKKSRVRQTQIHACLVDRFRNVFLEPHIFTSYTFQHVTCVWLIQPLTEITNAHTDREWYERERERERRWTAAATAAAAHVWIKRTHALKKHK